MTASPTPFFAKPAHNSDGEHYAENASCSDHSGDANKMVSAAMPSEEIERVREMLRSIPTGIQTADQLLDEAARIFAPILAEKEREIRRAIREVVKWSQVAGEAEGRLEMSKAAGIVEGWKARALAAEAALAAERSQGLVLVPLEPTKAMLEALDGDGDRIWDSGTEHYFRNEDEAFWYARQVWAAMVRAAAIRAGE